MTDKVQQQSEWRVTKATVGQDGVMRWQATTTKFSRDVQGDLVTKGFYAEAIRRIKVGAAPTPFFSVAHYGKEDNCLACGHTYKAMTEYQCPECGKFRAVAGIATDVYIDRDQPKAKGVFFPTPIGKSMFDAIRKDIETNAPQSDRIRISMGFYPDHDGVISKSGGRDFTKGWIEHFAGTRVPVVPETPITAELGVEKSMNIRTKEEDAASMVPQDQVAELKAIDNGRLRVKSGTDEIVLKSKGKCPKCGEALDPNEVDCPHCGAMIGKSDTDVTLPEELSEDDVEYVEEIDELSEDDPEYVDETEELGEDDAEYLEETDELEEDDAEYVDETEELDEDDPEYIDEPDELSEDDYEYKSETEDEEEESEEQEEGEETEDEEEGKKAAPATEAMSDVSFSKSDTVDALAQEAAEALDIVAKALVAPGGNKTEMLAQAANLVSAIRDYAHSVAGSPETAEGQAAQAGVPAPAPGTKVGGNPAPVPEAAVKETPAVSDEQEEAVEAPEEHAAETPQDEAEEHRLKFSKQPTEPAKAAAKAPPKPVPTKKAFTKDIADPSETELIKWAKSMHKVIKSNTSMSRVQKYELAQKSLNALTPRLVEMINDATPVAAEDLQEVVQKEVKSAVERVESQYQEQMEQLKALVTTLMASRQEKSAASPAMARRRSLPAMPQVSKATTSSEGLTVPALGGDQVQFKRYSASEVAKSTVTVDTLFGQRPRY